MLDRPLLESGDLCEWGSGEEWTAEIDVPGIAYRGKRITLSRRNVDTDAHYTNIIVSDLRRNIQKRTEETVRSYLGSMYRFDLVDDKLKILYNGEEIKAPDEYEFDTDPEGKPMRRDLPAKIINGKKIRGWVAVLKRGGRRYGGFSLFQSQRQVQDYPNAWRPRRIFGGVDDEGANNLVSQRLIGLIEVDGFEVSHTKDSILFEDDEEEELEKFLYDITKDYRDYAQKRRGARGQPWSREKVRDLLTSMKKEFTSSEMKDAVNNSLIPPMETILANNKQQLASVTEDEKIDSFDILQDLKVNVYVQEKSEFEPHVTIITDAEPGIIHVIINGLHPYYNSLESTDSIDECIRQYIYDAISEYRVSKLVGRVNPDSVRRIKNDLLRAQIVRVENAARDAQEGEFQAIIAAQGSDKD